MFILRTHERNRLKELAQTNTEVHRGLWLSINESGDTENNLLPLIAEACRLFFRKFT